MGRPKGSKNKPKTGDKGKKTNKGRKPRSDIGKPRGPRSTSAPTQATPAVVEQRPTVFKAPPTVVLDIPVVKGSEFIAPPPPVMSTDNNPLGLKRGDRVKKTFATTVGIECVYGKVNSQSQGSHFIRVEWDDHSNQCHHVSTLLRDD